MNRTARTIALAAPLATVVLSLGVGPALAEPAGPALDTISSAEKQGPVNPHLPEVDDTSSQPEDPDQPTGPDGPDDKVSIPPCPTHGGCGDEPDDKKGPNDEKDPGDDDSSTGDEIEKPTRIDAGAATSGTSDDLAWLLTGGVLIAMTGAAYAARRRERTSA
jgi:hypothetical protein